MNQTEFVSALKGNDDVTWIDEEGVTFSVKDGSYSVLARLNKKRVVVRYEPLNRLWIVTSNRTSVMRNSEYRFMVYAKGETLTDAIDTYFSTTTELFRVL